jgi:hypothetical protein
MARMLIEEADRRWHGMAAFLERSGMDQNAELVGRLAHRAERQKRWNAIGLELGQGGINGPVGAPTPQGATARDVSGYKSR